MKQALRQDIQALTDRLTQETGIQVQCVTLPENQMPDRGTSLWQELWHVQLPVVVAGWLAQKQLVRGLPFGAVE